MATDSYSLLRKAQALTGWTHDQLGEIVGVPRSTVQAVIQGRLTEYLTAPQTHALLAAVRLYRDTVIQGAEEMETFS